MRLVAHFPQQMLRNALYQYTICTFPRNKFPDNAKFAEFRNNHNLRLETLNLKPSVKYKATKKKAKQI